MIKTWRWACGDDSGTDVISFSVWSPQGCGAWREGKGREGVLQESHTAVPETAAAPSPNSSEEKLQNPAAQNRLWHSLGNIEELPPRCEYSSKSHQLSLNVEMILLLLLCSRIEFSPCLNCFGPCRKEVLSMSFNFKCHQCFPLKPYLQCFSVIK